MHVLSKQSCVAFRAALRRFDSTATSSAAKTPAWKPPKLPTKEEAEFIQVYRLTPPAWSHPANPHTHQHTQIPHLDKIALLFIPPILFFAYRTIQHERHEKEHVEEIRPEYKPMEYLRINRTPFPWGDGKHSLFHNPKRNPLPGEGYQE